MTRRRVDKVTCTCKTCGTVFHRVPSMVAKFCSKECYYEWMKNNITPPSQGESKEYLCLCCGKHFIDAVSTKRKYCSRKCYEQHSSKLRKGTRSKDTITRKCLVCEKLIHVRKSQRKEGKGKFCSKECYAEWQKETMQGTPFPSKPLRGKDNPNYKGKIKVVCEICGKKVDRYPSRYAERNHHFCSPECFKEARYLRPIVESYKHVELKNICSTLLTNLGWAVDLERWITLNGNHYRIDVYGERQDSCILVECGHCRKDKLEELRENYDNVFHFSYKDKERKKEELKEYAISLKCTPRVSDEHRN